MTTGHVWGQLDEILYLYLQLHELTFQAFPLDSPFVSKSHNTFRSAFTKHWIGSDYFKCMLILPIYKNHLHIYIAINVWLCDILINIWLCEVIADLHPQTEGLGVVGPLQAPAHQAPRLSPLHPHPPQSYPQASQPGWPRHSDPWGTDIHVSVSHKCHNCRGKNFKSDFSTRPLSMCSSQWTELAWMNLTLMSINDLCEYNDHSSAVATVASQKAHSMSCNIQCKNQIE